LPVLLALTIWTAADVRRYRRADGSVKGDKVHLFDFENPDNNDWLAVNQYTVQEGRGTPRRPDVVVFVNGIPLAVIELKNPADEDATIWTAYNQIQTYKAEIGSLFVFNELLIISDGLEARVGSLTADKDRFMPWRTIDGEDVAPLNQPQLEVLVKGVFDRRWFLDLVRHFVVFESDGKVTAKKLAGYHQFHAGRKAVEATVIGVPLAWPWIARGVARDWAAYPCSRQGPWASP